MIFVKREFFGGQSSFFSLVFIAGEIVRIGIFLNVGRCSFLKYKTEKLLGYWRRKVEVVMEGLKPEMVVEILRENDVHISLEEAELILAFMVKLAKLTLNQNVLS